MKLYQLTHIRQTDRNDLKSNGTQNAMPEFHTINHAKETRVSHFKHTCDSIKDI